MAKKKYDDLSKDDLIRLLESRDRRDKTRFGLVWEANEIEREKALNEDFVALDLDLSLSYVPPPNYQRLIIRGTASRISSSKETTSMLFATYA